jgi:predicted dehydrogenase
MGARLAAECADLNGAHLVGVWDQDPETAQELAVQCDAPRLGDLPSVLRNPAVHAVLVATPPVFHRRYACEAARAGKHVFCEKPMACTLADCDEIIETCRDRRVTLMVGHVSRFHPVLACVETNVRQRVLGEPVCVVLSRLGGPWADGGWLRAWRLKRNESGGALLEINSHELDLLRRIGGPVARVHAIGGRFRQHDADYPDQTVLSIEFRGGAVGLLHSSQASAIGAYGGRVDCSEGSIVFPSIFSPNPVVYLARFGEKQRTMGPEEFAGAAPLRAELQAFVDAIDHEAEPPVTGADGRAVVELALAAYESLDTGNPVTLPLRGPRPGA